MVEVKFAHISDTHLGARNFKLEEREKDFYRAFEKAVDKIIKENVDFVLHCGDLFESSKPSTSSVLVAIENFKKLKENEIPVFIIPGNHDIYLGETFISVLERIGLVINVAAKRYFSKEGNLYVHKGEVFNGVFIAGIPGIRTRIEESYRKFYPKFGDERIRIFMFHHTIDLVDKRCDIPFSLFPKGFNYYAGGHWHFPFFDEKNRVFYPGSTEYWRLDEMKAQKEKGFLIVRLSEDDVEYKFEKIETRKIIVERINCNNLSPFEVNNKLIEIVRKNPIKDGILILELYGRLREGNRMMIRSDRIMEIGESLGYLYVYVDDKDLLNPREKEVTKIREKTPEDLEEEYLRSKFSDKEVEVAKLIIEYLGKDLSAFEKVAAVRKIAEIIKNELL